MGFLLWLFWWVYKMLTNLFLLNGVIYSVVAYATLNPSMNGMTIAAILLSVTFASFGVLND